MSDQEMPQGHHEEPSQVVRETQENLKEPFLERPSERDALKDILQGMDQIKAGDELKSAYGPEVHVHYNIYQGNYVNNTGTIGGVDQSQGSAVSGGPAGPEKGVKACVRFFFQPETRFNALAALITLATFQMVPEAVFHELAQSLCGRLSAQASTEGKETPAIFQTAEDLLTPFQIQYVDDLAVQDPHALKLLCLAFRSQDEAMQVREQIWLAYPQLRGTLTQWLLDLRQQTGTAAGRRIGYAAMQGLACYASLDLAYARDTLAPCLERNCTAQADVKYLVVFFKQLMQWEHSRKLADILLCCWCERRGNLLWQIPYRLYGQGKNWKFQDEVPRILWAHLKRDLSQRMASILKEDRGYLVRPAHENTQVAELLAEGLAKCFSECRDFGGRYYVAAYFLTLLRWDYLTDFSEEPNMVFLRCLHKKKTRTALLPIFQLVWQRVELRGIARQILECHMREINMQGAPCAYLEKSFEYLAFTGRSADYNNTFYLLKQCAQREDVRPVAQHLLDFLAQCLKKRRADSTETRKA